MPYKAQPRPGQSNQPSQSTQSPAQAAPRAPASKPQPNPGGQTRPSFQPSGGSRTPPPAGSGGGSGGGGSRGRPPDFDIFFAVVEKDADGKDMYRVREVEVNGQKKWDRCGALWLSEGKNPLVKIEQDIPAGAQLTCRPVRSRNS